jgi:hypothetical protein
MQIFRLRHRYQQVTPNRKKLLSSGDSVPVQRGIFLLSLVGEVSDQDVQGLQLPADLADLAVRRLGDDPCGIDPGSILDRY